MTAGTPNAIVAPDGRRLKLAELPPSTQVISLCKLYARGAAFETQLSSFLRTQKPLRRFKGRHEKTRGRALARAGLVSLVLRILAAAPVSGSPSATELSEARIRFGAAEPGQCSRSNGCSSDGHLNEQSRLADGRQVQVTGQPQTLLCQSTLLHLRLQTSLHPSSQSRALRARERAAHHLLLVTIEPQ